MNSDNHKVHFWGGFIAGCLLTFVFAFAYYEREQRQFMELIWPYLKDDFKAEVRASRLDWPDLHDYAYLDR